MLPSFLDLLQPATQQQAPGLLGGTIPEIGDGLLQIWCGEAGVVLPAAPSGFFEASGVEIAPQQCLLAHVSVTGAFLLCCEDVL